MEKTFSSERELKKMIVEIGRRMWQRGYVAANDGNISVRLNERELLTTPTGVSKGFMSPEMIIKVDYNGHVLARQSRYKPSSEIKMHLEVYKERADVSSVVHAHPPFCTSFAVAGIPLDKCVLPEAIVVLGAVPIAKFGLPSTQEIPEAIRPFLKSSDALLLENHGALTFGTDLMGAYFKLETLEHSAQIVWNAIQLGNVNILPEKERDRLMTLRETYNLSGKVTQCESKPVTDNLTFEGVSEEKIREITKRVLDILKK
jgi:L-fuculose-phosphate aldolase